LIRPYIVEGVLAPTTEQHLKYMNWLHVYGKSQLMMMLHMALLVDEDKVSISLKLVH
jgi:hypothetical protein